MLPDHQVLRWVIYGIAVLQASIAPTALLYFLYQVLSTQTHQLPTTLVLPPFVHYWLLTELLFYLHFLITSNRMQHKKAVATMTTDERRQLVCLCLDNIDEVNEWMTGWFVDKTTLKPPAMDAICHDNVLEWLAWAFFMKPMDELADVQELEWMMDKFEGKCHVRFKPGYNAQLQSRRLNLDPINAYHRPFVFYVAIQCLTVFYELVLQWQYGMQKSHVRRPHDDDARIIMTYWHRDPAPTMMMDGHPHPLASYYRDDRPYPYTRSARKRTLKKPLVFIHGIGAGVMCYGPFLHALLQQLGDRPVFFVELPFVSMRCCEDVPTMQEMTFAVESMLQDHGYTSATFVGHSLGSAVTSWCCKQIPHMVDGVVLIDPICFMLHYSDVCHNFVYREPETVSQAIVKYFASSELYISHYISRQFYWFETALYLTSKHPAFPSLVPNTTPMPKNVKVYLSECDNIVNSPRVSTYLQKNGIPVHWMYGLDHASFLFHPSWQQHIVHTLKMFTQ